MTELGINGQEYSPIGEQQGAAGFAVVSVMNSLIRHERVS